MIHYIDDEAMIRDLFKDFIAFTAYKSIGFASGEDYLSYLDSPNFIQSTAIISDVTMPGINGYDLTLEIRKRYPLQKIIVCTRNPDEQHHISAISQTCYTLDKPFNPKKLISILDSLLSCENTHRTGTKNKYSKQCEFAIDHVCPMYKQSE
ncbi:response regulator [Ghiorsea bivora]|uniref:response regulator n=1 Tax=Ghiorsea bivora TaxID=1485545 RepID=UPI00057163C0|nr:response regulator [Ghiorsea bivora]